MAKFERNCVVCGKQYIFCPNKNDGTPRWYLIYCGENCKDIWEHITTIYDRDGARAAAKGLKELDLSYIGDIREDAKEKIRRIFKEAHMKLPVELEVVEEAESSEDVVEDVDGTDSVDFVEPVNEDEDSSFAPSVSFYTDTDALSPSVD